ncbi:hypothetical protein ACFPVZ_18555 [Actinacidiphila bryophytorum]|uniref:hypothetical protein n=1 Tax=Actinacidiphila bryophytorum TaxID=1436133 RepID=UPI00360FF119
MTGAAGGSPPPPCPRRDLAADLALGVLHGQERAAALAHVADCEECAGRLAAFTAVGDGLLALLPEVQPPAGFEQRGLAALGRGARPAAARRWVPAAAAAAAAALVFGAAGWFAATAAHHGPGGTAAPVSRTAPLLSADHRPAGRLFLYAGDPARLYMAVSGDPGLGDRTVYCQLLRRDGSVVPVGSFRLVGGSGWWDAPAPADGAAVTGARLVTAAGAVLASGSL